MDCKIDVGGYKSNQTLWDNATNKLHCDRTSPMQFVTLDQNATLKFHSELLVCVIFHNWMISANFIGDMC